MICNTVIIHGLRKFIRYQMNSADRLDFVGMARGWSAPTTAIPSIASLSFVMSENLGCMSKDVVSHLANNNRDAFVKFIRRDDIMCLSGSTLIHPKDHIF